MRFISGIKELFRNPLYAIIITTFLLAWFLSLIGYTIFPEVNDFKNFVYFFIQIFIGFILVLLVFSLKKPINEMSVKLIIIAFLIGLPVLLFFSIFVFLFYAICFFANTFFTSFFAFLVCRDTSTQLDDYLYKRKKSKIITRTLEFLLFGLLDLWIINIATDFLSNEIGGIKTILDIISIFYIVLVGLVILRLLFKRKFAAYITLFLILAYFYLFYNILSFIIEEILINALYFVWFSFIIDLLLFFYILGSIFSRVDYLKEKIKVFSADTISLFVIIMKLIVQISYIYPDLPGVNIAENVDLEGAVLLIFLACTLFLGTHTIFTHKHEEAIIQD